MKQNATTAEKTILGLLLRFLRVKRVFSPKLSEEGGVQRGVWETSVEQPVRDDEKAYDFKSL